MKKNAFIIFSLCIVFLLLNAGCSPLNVNKKKLKGGPIETLNQTSTPTPSPNDITNWLTYTNEKIGLELKYPNDWRIRSKDESIIIDKKNCQFSLWRILDDTISENQKYKDELLQKGCRSKQETIDGVVFEKITCPKQLLIVAADLGEYFFQKNNRNYGISLADYAEFSKAKGQTPPSDYDIKCQVNFDQILSTFKFIEPTADTTGLPSKALAKEGWKTYRNEANCYMIQYPDPYRVGYENNITNYDQNDPKYERGNPDGVAIQIQKHSFSTDEDFSSFITKLIAQGPSEMETKIEKISLGSFQYTNKTLNGPGGAFDMFYAPASNGKSYYSVLVWHIENDANTVNNILQEFVPTECGPKVDMTGWQTYTNERYGFEFKYPRLNYPNEFTVWENLGDYDPAKYTVRLQGNNLALAGELIINNLPEKKYESITAEVSNEQFEFNGIKADFAIKNDGPNSYGYDRRGIFVSFQEDGNKYLFLFAYEKQGADQTELVKQILSTFRFSTTSIAASDSINLKKFNSEKYGFEVQYPDNWEVNVDETSVVFRRIGDPTVFQSSVGSGTYYYATGMAISVATTSFDDIEKLVAKERKDSESGIGAYPGVEITEPISSGVKTVWFKNCIEGSNTQGPRFIKNGYVYSIVLPYDCDAIDSDSDPFKDYYLRDGSISKKILSTFKFTQ